MRPSNADGPVLLGIARAAQVCRGGPEDPLCTLQRLAYDRAFTK